MMNWAFFVSPKTFQMIFNTGRIEVFMSELNQNKKAHISVVINIFRNPPLGKGQKLLFSTVRIFPATIIYNLRAVES